MRGRPVSRILSVPPPGRDDHSSGPAVTGGLELPTRASRAEASLPRYPRRDQPARGPYSALLPVGLAVPVRLPVPRWALTPPFHPDPGERGAVCSLWRFPSGCPGRALPGTAASWSPDFPRPRRAAAIRPSAQASPKGSRLRGQRASRARPAAIARSASSSGPVAQGRNRRRKAASSSVVRHVRIAEGARIRREVAGRRRLRPDRQPRPREPPPVEARARIALPVRRHVRMRDHACGVRSPTAP